MATVKFTLSNGKEFNKTVENLEADEMIKRFTLSQMEFEQPWLVVDHGTWISRDAIVTVAPVSEDGPMVAFS